MLAVKRLCTQEIVLAAKHGLVEAIAGDKRVRG